eukprot:COSAG02_NODE_50561_length_319_cov_2.345455_1_plen_20_part_01
MIIMSVVLTNVGGKCGVGRR